MHLFIWVPVPIEFLPFELYVSEVQTLTFSKQWSFVNSFYPFSSLFQL